MPATQTIEVDPQYLLRVKPIYWSTE